MENNPLIDEISKAPEIVLPDHNLTDAQKLLILKKWNENESNPPSIAELIKVAWPELPSKYLDGRLLWGKSVKKLLIEKDIRVLTIADDKSKMELTKEQKEYIRNNCSTSKPFDMAKVIFGNKMLSPASIEMRLVAQFIKTLDPQVVLVDKDIPDFDYRPPKTIVQVLSRIRKYVSETEKWEMEKLTSQQVKCCEMLIHYLHDLRFKRQIDSYQKQEDKNTFESEFVKYVYNKPDLAQEEISQYIALCSFIVSEFNINAYLEMLKTQMQDEYDAGGRVSGNLVDAIESARADLDACSKRQSALYNSLIEKRSEKVKGRMKDTASILNVIELWKNEESRKKMLLIANNQRSKLEDEINRLESMEDIICIIAGISKNEVLNG